MTREQLVNGLKKRLIDSNIEEYEERFTRVDIKSDPVGVEMKEFHNKLNAKDREVFFKIIRQIEIDTIADFFGFLDGIYWIEGQTEDMNLVNLKNPERKLNEDLTDTFLSLIHKWDR